MARRDKKPKFPTAVVIDAVDLPRDAEDWLCDQDISTHYAETLGRVKFEDSRVWLKYDEKYDDVMVDPQDHPLTGWLLKQGVKLEDYTEDGTFYFAIIGT